MRPEKRDLRGAAVKPRSSKLFVRSCEAVAVVVALGVFGYYFARGAAHVAREVYRDFVSG